MNIRILHENAVEFIRWRVPDALVRVIHLYFSDPWPKTRHHKKRVVQDAFLGETWRILQPGGELRVVTDHDELWAWDQTHFANWMRPDHDSPTRKHGGFPPIPFEWAAFSPPESADSGELVGTNFERKFRKEGRGFHAGVLRKLI